MQDTLRSSTLCSSALVLLVTACGGPTVTTPADGGAADQVVRVFDFGSVADLGIDAVAAADLVALDLVVTDLAPPPDLINCGQLNQECCVTGLLCEQAYRCYAGDDGGAVWRVCKP